MTEKQTDIKDVLHFCRNDLLDISERTTSKTLRMYAKRSLERIEGLQEKYKELR